MQTRQMIRSFIALIEIYLPTSSTHLVCNTERNESHYYFYYNHHTTFFEHLKCKIYVTNEQNEEKTFQNIAI